MPQEPTTSQTGVLEHLAQPVFFLEKGAVVYRNAAARALTGGETKPELLFTPEMLACYQAFDGTGTMDLLVRLGGSDYSATVHREGTRDILIASARPVDDDVEMALLDSVSRTVRRELAELFDAASSLAPLVERQRDERLQDEAGRIHRGLLRLLRLSSNMADYSAMLGKQKRALMQKTELCRFVEQLCRRVEPYCREIGVELQYQGTGLQCFAAVDQQLLERAILNLLSNALRSTPRGRGIHVHLAKTPAEVRIFVDNDRGGHGPDETAPVIDRFRFLDPLVLGHTRGVGLGLTLVRQIACLHGGAVMTNSTEDRTSVVLSVSRRTRPSELQELHSPALSCDYCGEHDHVLLELSDLLPPRLFHSIDLL